LQLASLDEAQEERRSGKSSPRFCPYGDAMALQLVACKPFPWTVYRYRLPSAPPFVGQRPLLPEKGPPSPMLGSPVPPQPQWHSGAGPGGGEQISISDMGGRARRKNNTKDTLEAKRATDTRDTSRSP
jgi:hypothetical protein